MLLHQQSSKLKGKKHQEHNICISIDLCMRKSENYKRMDEKRKKQHTHNNNNKRYGNERNERKTQSTHNTLRWTSVHWVYWWSAILSVCVYRTQNRFMHTFMMFSVILCVYVCVLVAAMFILPVCIFVYTSTTQCQNTAAFVHAFDAQRGITSTFVNCTQTTAATSFSCDIQRFGVANANFIVRSFQQSAVVLFLTCLTHWFRH